MGIGKRKYINTSFLIILYSNLFDTLVYNWYVIIISSLLLSTGTNLWTFKMFIIYDFFI